MGRLRMGGGVSGFVREHAELAIDRVDEDYEGK